MHALAQLCVRRPVFTTMLILALIVVGAFSYFSLGVDLFPKVDIPAVSVSVSDPGASPEEVETEITKKVEDAVNTISLIDEVRSTSSEGRSVVTVAFLLAKNGDIGAAGNSKQGQPHCRRSAANREAARGAEVRSRCDADHSNCRLRPAIHPRSDADRR